MLTRIPHLNHLSLDYIHLNSSVPYVEINSDNSSELCIYALTGTAHIHAPELGWHALPFGSRRSVRDDNLHILRVPKSHPRIIITTTNNADFLIGAWDGPSENEGLFLSAFDQRDHFTHKVGEGSYYREVREFPNPPGFRIHCGETLNAPGSWSSYPAHATPKEAEERHAEHEEAFFVISPGEGIIAMNGWYNDGGKTSETVRVKNGQILATPLGSHPIVFTPPNWGLYVWMYVSFLRKTYNTKSTDVGTYVR